MATWEDIQANILTSEMDPQNMIDLLIYEIGNRDGAIRSLTKERDYWESQKKAYRTLIAERDATIQRMSDQYCEAIEARDEAERELKLAIEEVQRLQAGSDGPWPK